MIITYGHNQDILLLVFLSLYLFILYVIGQLISQVAKTVNYKFMAHVLASIISFIMVVLQLDIHIFFEFNPKHMLTLFYPPIVFKIIYELDLVVFRQHIWKIIIYAIVMSASFSVILGLIMVLLTGNQFTNLIICIYGFSMGSIDYMDSSISILSMGSMKSTLVLLQLESVIGCQFCHVILKLALAILDGHIWLWYHIVNFLLRLVVGGILCGLIAGKLLHTVIEWFLNNLKDLSAFMILSTIGVYFICEHMFNVSGGLAVLMYAYSFAMYKTRIPIQLGKHLEAINTCVAKIGQAFMFYFTTVPLFVRTMQHFDTSQLLEYLCLPIMSLYVRLVLVVVLLVAMGYIKSREEIPKAFITCLLAKRGALQAVYFMHVLGDRNAHRLGAYCAPHTYIYLTTALIHNMITTTVYSNTAKAKNAIINTNLMNWPKQLQVVQQYFISMMRMNTVYEDVNWRYVMRCLKPTFAEGKEKHVHMYQTRQSFCISCKKVVTFEPTPKEYKYLLIDARQIIIKAHKMSFITQYESGKFQKHVITILLNFIESASATKDLSLNPKLFKQFIHKETMFFKIRSCISNVLPIPNILKPRKRYRRICYRLVMHYSYEMCLLIVLCFSIVVQFWDLAERNELGSILFLKGCLVLIYAVDFVLKILAYSHTELKQGFKTYFTNTWDQFDFIVLITLIMEFLVKMWMFSLRNYEATLVTLVLGMTARSCASIKYFKIFKIMFVMKRYEFLILKFLDNQIGFRIMLAVDIGEALIKSYDEVLHAMPHLIGNEAIREELTQKLTQDRTIVKHELVNRIAGRDWVALTSKTNLAIRNCFFAMKNYVGEMLSEGLIDGFESEKLKHSHELSLQSFLKIKHIRKPTDEELIFHLAFAHNDAVACYCFVNSYKNTFEKGSVIIQEGNNIDGIMIVTNGLLNVVYEPIDEDLFAKYGALPAVDIIDEENMFTPKAYYLMCGNTFGEMGVLTNRPYHCTVTAEEETECIIIPIQTINEIRHRVEICERGVHSLMWTYFTLNVVNAVMWKTKLFTGSSKDAVVRYCSKGFYPYLMNCAEFKRTTSMEDIVLVEGVIKDQVNSEYFIAPCYLPRHVQLIELIRKEDFMVQPQLFVIPVDSSMVEQIAKDLRQNCKARTFVNKDFKETKISTTIESLPRRSILKKPLLPPSTSSVVMKKVVPKKKPSSSMYYKLPTMNASSSEFDVTRSSLKIEVLDEDDTLASASVMHNDNRLRSSSVVKTMPFQSLSPSAASVEIFPIKSPSDTTSSPSKDSSVHEIPGVGERKAY